jgi:hypothetical protein
VHNPNLDLVNQHLPIDHAQSVFLERFFTRMTGGMRKGKSYKDEVGRLQAADCSRIRVFLSLEFLIRKIPTAMKYAKNLNFVGLNSIKQKVIPSSLSDLAKSMA